MDSTQRVICILGVHRGGTSMITGILEKLGVYLGPEDQMLPVNPEENPTGFKEHKELTQIGDAVLEVMGGSWHEPPILGPKWWDSQMLNVLKEQAQSVIQRDFADSHVWGWKDPRSSLILPFWWDVLPVAPDHVVCIRNPFDVALSLQKRNEFSIEKGIDLWVKYMGSAIKNTHPYTRALTSYETFFGSDWRRRVRFLARFAGLESSMEHTDIMEDLSKFVQEDLWRNRTSHSELISLGSVDTQAKMMYLMLESLNGSGDDMLRFDMLKAVDLLCGQFADERLIPV